MPSDQRRKMIKDLNDRVEAILSGDDTNALTVREGIQAENNSKTDNT